MIRVFHPGSRILMLTFFHPGSRIPDPGVKKVPNPGSRIRIRNTGSDLMIFGLLISVKTVLWIRNGVNADQDPNF
jgi:hypothetical protein